MATTTTTGTATTHGHHEFNFDDPVLTWLRENSNNYNVMLETPYGMKKRRYFDFTASGQPFRPIEDLITNRVLPHMTNTHSESSASAEMINQLYRGSQDKVRRYTNCHSDDLVIWVGQGCTSAVNKLIGLLGIRIPEPMQTQWDLKKHIPPEQRPIILRSRLEHHSNDIPWRETIADMEFVPFDKMGRIDVSAIDKILSRPEYRDRPMKIGTFAASANVSGVLADVDGLAAAMHDHGGLAFFDYAAGAPYLPINIHPDEPNDRYRKDAVFVSMHKFAGGPQGPGLLIVNRKLAEITKVPADPGGGTILFSSPWNHKYYDKKLENREEGGTPQVVQAIRAGLAWDLKHIIGDRIHALEQHCIQKVTKAWRGNPKINILGPDPLETPRLGMMSMLLANAGPAAAGPFGTDKSPQLHYNMAVRMLSDLYGIQVRGGCMCAHTYSHTILNIDRPTADWVQDQMSAGHLAMKPGFIRVSFGASVSKEDLDVLIDAIPDLAENWQKYAEDYVIDPKTADCRHKSHKGEKASIVLEGPGAPSKN